MTTPRFTGIEAKLYANLYLALGMFVSATAFKMAEHMTDARAKELEAYQADFRSIEIDMIKSHMAG